MSTDEVIENSFRYAIRGRLAELTDFICSARLSVALGNYDSAQDTLIDLGAEVSDILGKLSEFKAGAICPAEAEVR